MNKRKFVFAAVLPLALSACHTQHSNERTGSFVGSVAGAVIGSKFGKGHGRLGFSIAGSLVGSHIGGSIGRQMDRDDHRRAQQAMERNRTGQTARWYNNRTHRQYAYRPRRTYYRDAVPCRDYVMETVYRGRVEKIYGTACRQPDGSWRTLR